MRFRRCDEVSIDVIRMPFLTVILSLLLLQRCAWRRTRRRRGGDVLPHSGWLAAVGRSVTARSMSDSPRADRIDQNSRLRRGGVVCFGGAPRAPCRLRRCDSRVAPLRCPRAILSSPHDKNTMRRMAHRLRGSAVSALPRPAQRAAPAAPSPFCVFATRADDGGAGVGDDGVVAVDESVPSRPPKTRAICHVLAPRADDGGDGVADDGVVGVA